MKSYVSEVEILYVVHMIDDIESKLKKIKDILQWQPRKQKTDTSE